MPDLTVKDLKEALRNAPDDALVVITGQERGYYDEPVETVAQSAQVVQFGQRFEVSGY